MIERSIHCVRPDRRTLLTGSTITFDAHDALAWTTEALKSNSSYFRLRRELFTKLVQIMDQGLIRCDLDDDAYIALRQFLTNRNDAITDDKRLSFDKAVLQLRDAARAAIKGSAASSTASGSSVAPSK